MWSPSCPPDFVPVAAAVQEFGGLDVLHNNVGISVEGGAPDELHDKLLEIADKCPVHRTLESASSIVTHLSE